MKMNSTGLLFTAALVLNAVLLTIVDATVGAEYIVGTPTTPPKATSSSSVSERSSMNGNTGHARRLQTRRASVSPTTARNPPSTRKDYLTTAPPPLAGATSSGHTDPQPATATTNSNNTAAPPPSSGSNNQQSKSKFWNWGLKLILTAISVTVIVAVEELVRRICRRRQNRLDAPAAPPVNHNNYYGYGQRPGGEIAMAPLN